ncbi:MAG: Tfp pilus assembly protein FimT/FimU [Chthoniobacterales bacterium]
MELGAIDYLPDEMRNDTRTTKHSSPITHYPLLHSSSAYTLIEILIALALVAILLMAAGPFMRDAFKTNQSDAITESITSLVEKTRLEALESGNAKQIDLSDSKLLPKGWKLEVERMSDKKFHAPARGEEWNFNSEGICDPMSLRILGNGSSTVLKFDPITGQVVHDEN